MKRSAWSALLDWTPEPADGWLARMLHRNRDCRYLAQFGSPASYERFADNVPLTTYEELSSWIERAASGETDVLFAGLPVGIEQTGGTVGGGKFLPFSQPGLDDAAAAIVPWLQSVVKRFNITGSAYFSISPAARRSAFFGLLPIGLSDAAFLGPAVGRILGEVSAVPPTVGELTSINEWRRLTLEHLEMATDLELISVWSPTFLLNLFDGVDAARLWPRLKLVSCWADGRSATGAAELARRLPSAHIQPKGLVSTEAVVTIPDEHDRPVLSRFGMFEFLDEKGLWPCAAIGELAQYEVVVTTANGLYRYRSGDLVTCIGRTENGDPILRFDGRMLTSDLVGEKLTEAFVARCLDGIEGFRFVAPNAAGNGYLLIGDAVTEQVAGAVELRLCVNPQYDYARRIGQLTALRPVMHPAARTIYEEAMLKRGVRLGDIKPVALRRESHWEDIFRGSSCELR